MRQFQGSYQAKNYKFAIICGRFNELITKNLLEGAVHALKQHGVDEDNITLVWVPGSFEIPVVARQLALSSKFDAIISLGAVIRGSTPHFEYVSSQMASGIASASLETGIPILFGVLTTDTIEQAIERSGTKAGNKGSDCAQAAIEMADLMNQLKADIREAPSSVTDEFDALQRS